MFQKFFKKSNAFWIIVTGIFLSYIIVGAGVYLWQHNIVKQAKEKTEKTLMELNQEKLDLERNVADSEKKMQDKLENYKNNVIDLATVKAGDRLANGMVVKKIEPQSIEFEGKVVISGNYEYDTVPGMRLVCLCPDPISREKLPKIDSLTPESFCFSNQEIAKNRFGPPGSKGEAVVAIDNYKVTMFDGYAPYAELIKTIEKK